MIHGCIRQKFSAGQDEEGLDSVLHCRGYDKRGKQKWSYPPGQNVEPVEGGTRSDCLQRLDAQVKQVYDSLQPGSLLLVATGQGDTTQQRHKEVNIEHCRS